MTTPGNRRRAVAELTGACSPPSSARRRSTRSRRCDPRPPRSRRASSEFGDGDGLDARPARRSCRAARRRCPGRSSGSRRRVVPEHADVRAARREAVRRAKRIAAWPGPCAGCPARAAARAGRTGAGCAPQQRTASFDAVRSGSRSVAAGGAGVRVAGRDEGEDAGGDARRRDGRLLRDDRPSPSCATGVRAPALNPAGRTSGAGVIRGPRRSAIAPAAMGVPRTAAPPRCSSLPSTAPRRPWRARTCGSRPAASAIAPARSAGRRRRLALVVPAPAPDGAVHHGARVALAGRDGGHAGTRSAGAGAATSGSSNSSRVRGPGDLPQLRRGPSKRGSRRS